MWGCFKLPTSIESSSSHIRVTAIALLCLNDISQGCPDMKALNFSSMLWQLLSVLICALGLTSAFADAGSLDGQFIQLGVGGSRNAVSLSGAQDPNSSASLNNNVSSSSFNGLVAIGHSQDLGAMDSKLKGINLGLSAFFMLGNQKGLANSSSGSSNDGTYTGIVGGNFAIKNTWGISLEPGYYLQDTTLAYLKMAYVGAQGDASIYYSGSTTGPSYVGGNRAVSGYGLGFGVKQVLTEHVYLAVDALQTYYSNISIGQAGAKFTQAMAFASFGYRF